MPREIRAAVSPGGGASPRIEELLLDDPLPDEMVMEVAAAGVCHTDLGSAAWSEEPRVLGHEGAGTVIAVGSQVKDFAVGDRIVATFGSCGHCPTCDSGRPAYCVDGIDLNIHGVRSGGRPGLTRMDGSAVGGAFFQQSSFATHALVTRRSAVRLPDEMDFVTAAPLGCGIQTGAGAVINQLGLGTGDPLVVIGCGAVGLAAIMAGRIVGCDPILALDLNRGRLEIARGLGAAHTVDGSEPDLVEQVRRITGYGAAAVLDTAGTQQTFEAGIAILRPGGSLGVLTLPGAFDEPVHHPGGMAFLTTSIIGIIEGDSVPNEFLPRLIAWQQSGQLPYEQLIETFAFEDIAAAFEASRDQTVIKPVLTFGQETRQ